LNPGKLARAAGTKDRRSAIPPDGAEGGGPSRLVAAPDPSCPLPNDNMDWCRFFHLMKAKRRNIKIAAPATPPTTPPTTTGVGVFEELEPFPLPDAAVLVDVLLVLAAVPPPPMPPPALVATFEDEELGE